MIGAIAGDIIGSVYESQPTKNMGFENAYQAGQWIRWPGNYLSDKGFPALWWRGVTLMISPGLDRIDILTNGNTANSQTA